jgi:hypothetical protein
VLWILLVTGITPIPFQLVPPISLGGVAVILPLTAVQAWLAFLGLREWRHARSPNPSQANA